MNKHQSQIEGLMKPRYKLEIRYPHYPFDGDILLVDENGELYHKQEGYCRSLYKIMEFEAKESKCFRLMQWFEEREPGQMPQYVKHNESGHVYFLNRENVEIFNKGGFLLWNAMKYIHYEDCLPSTRQEYKDYINQTKEQ